MQGSEDTQLEGNRATHLQLILPRVNPTEITTPSTCPHRDCRGTHFRFHQQVTKPLSDTIYQEVTAHRYQCLQCGRTFRVYPPGVTQAHMSQRVKGLAVLLYLLGLSYGAVSRGMEALGAYICKSRVYDAVHEMAEQVQELKRAAIFEGLRTPATGNDVTMVKYSGQWLPLRLAMDADNGLVLRVDALSQEHAHSLKERLEPIVAAVDAEFLATDGANGFKMVDDELELEHEVRKSPTK